MMEDFVCLLIGGAIGMAITVSVEVILFWILVVKSEKK